MVNKYGVKHKELESQLLKYLEVPNITLFTNGHLALECIIAALDLKGSYNNSFTLHRQPMQLF